MPTFRRIKEKHPDAEMKYFARGKLWDSADEARRSHTRADRFSETPRKDAHGGERDRRGREWRPGGEHRDPRQPFKDAKKTRNRDRRQQRWERKHARPPSPPREGPHRDQLALPPDRRTGVQRSRQGPVHRPFDKAQGRPFDKPHGRPGGEPRAAHGDRRPRKDWQSRPPKQDWKDGGRRFARNQQPPPRPPGPNREPPPSREPKPEPPPRPSEPAIKPPGPPERGGGRFVKRKRKE